MSANPQHRLRFTRLWIVLATLTGLHGQPTAAQLASSTSLTVIKSQHARISTPNDIVRIAVGDSEILSAEALNTRELLLLGKNAGRTTLLVWFRDGSTREYICTVQRDLSLLRSSLKLIHPAIEAEIAPDRDAIVLTGVVPDITFSRAAESAARNYLDAAQSRSASVLVQAPPNTANPSPADQAAAPASPGQDALRVTAAPQPTGSVINLLRLEILPLLPESKILDAIQPLGGSGIHVRRIQKGLIRDDEKDVFVLEGRVPNQVMLTRILAIAAQVITGQMIDDQDIRVIADESGALPLGGGAGGNGGGQTGGGIAGGGGAGGGLTGGGIGGRGGNLQNQVRRNVARAKILEAGRGRVLSFLEVADIPQIRVDIRLYEVNRNKLRTFNPNSAFVAGTSRQALSVPGSSQNSPGGSRSTEFANLLGFLTGTFVNETQLTTAHFALDTVLTYLEQQGVARSLASPSLTVLSGELAQFQVGGDIPIQEAFAPAIGGGQGGTNNGSTLGVFSSVTFVNFGIQLNIRPLVGDDDTLTLDVAPIISTPDNDLTTAIRQNTGTNQLTTAFKTRSLRTSARLQDGQALLVGGLLSQDVSDNQASTPGVRDIPGVGNLFRRTNRADDDLELVIVVNPAIVRDPLADTGLWQYPAISEIKDAFSKALSASPEEARGTN